MARAAAKLRLAQPTLSGQIHALEGALNEKLFERAGLRPKVAQVAEEKQTIVNLVAAGLGETQMGCVTGDDLLPRISELLAAGCPFANLDTGQPLAELLTKAPLSPVAVEAMDSLVSNVVLAIEGVSKKHLKVTVNGETAFAEDLELRAGELAIEALIQLVSSIAFLMPGGLGVQEGGFVLIGGLLALIALGAFLFAWRTALIALIASLEAAELQPLLDELVQGPARAALARFAEAGITPRSLAGRDADEALDLAL
mgnify:CR=1 FL=1